MEMVKQSIQYAKAASKLSSQAIAEGELTPPPSLPPISQILAIDGRAGASAEAMEDRILIDGMVTLSVIYACSSGKVHGFESIAMFKHNIDVPGISPQAYCNVTPSVNEIRYHLTSGGIHVRSQIKLDCVCEENVEINAIARIEGTESKCVPFNASKKSSIKEEMEIREDIRLPRSAEKLLGIGGYARVNDISIEGDKANIEGVLRINIIFVTPDGTLMQMPSSMPFSHRIVVSREIGSPSAQVRIIMLSAVLADEDIATADASIEITMNMETMQEFEMISDAYSSEKLLECVKESIPICESRNMSSRCTLRQTIGIPHSMPAADRVLIALLRPNIESATPMEGTINIKGMLHANIVYLDREGNIHGFESQMPFECEGEAAGLKPHMDVSLDVGCELVHAGASGMDIPLQCALDVSMKAKECKELLLVTDMIENEREPAATGLIAYFPEEGEGLWDIGKRFGISMDELRGLNPDVAENPQSVILNIR